jgi:hypothetical protein
MNKIILNGSVPIVQSFPYSSIAWIKQFTMNSINMNGSSDGCNHFYKIDGRVNVCLIPRNVENSWTSAVVFNSGGLQIHFTGHVQLETKYIIQY